MKKVFLILTLAMLAGQLAGCGAARQAAADKAISQANSELYIDFSDNRLDVIRNKVTFYGNKYIVSTAVPNECPNEEEKVAINLLRSKLMDAKNKYYSISTQYNFYDSPAMLGFITIDDQNLGRLYNCKLTFKSYAETRERALDAAREYGESIKRRKVAESQIRSEQTAAAIGAALQGAGAAIQQQQAIRQANRPRQTICRQIGDSVNCTEY